MQTIDQTKKKTPALPESPSFLLPPLVLSRSGHGSVLSGRFTDHLLLETSNILAEKFMPADHKWVLRLRFPRSKGELVFDPRGIHFA
jgi:hypothetical protein